MTQAQASAPSISPAEYKARQNELLQRLEADADTVVAVFGEGSAAGMGAKSHGGLRYLSGWDGQETPSLFLFGAGPALLLLSSPFLLPMARETCPDYHVEAVPPSQWAQRIKDHIGPRYTVYRVGFDYMPSLLAAQFEAECDLVLSCACDAMVDQLRASKSTSELHAMQAGARICDSLFDGLGRHLVKDQPVWKTQLTLEHEARMAGAGYCKTWLTVAPQADYPRYWRNECQACPSEGDQILFGIALTVGGYWAHSIRMGSVGPINPDHDLLWGRVHDALDAGQNMLRPENNLSRADTAMTQCLEQTLALGAPTSINRFRNGHGLGLSYEEPSATDNFLQVWGDGQFAATSAPAHKIAENAVFELHPNLFIPELGGAALGDMFVVTQGKAQRLLDFPLTPFELKLHTS